MFQAIKCIFLFFAVLPISDCMAHEEKRNAIKKCTETQKGIDLIIGHGNQTQANINPLYFVPSIEIDNVTTSLTLIITSVKHRFDLFFQEFKRDEQDDLLYHFSRDFCRRYRAKYHKKLSNC